MASRARLSLVQDSGQYASSCGYCGTRETHEDSSWSHGMMAEVLTPEAYQELIDRGWRRSGRWLYQPVNEHTCCQLITIRLDVHNFRANKEQRRALRRWEEFLAGAPLTKAGHPPAAGQSVSHSAHQHAAQLLENPDGVQFPALGAGAGALGPGLGAATAAALAEAAGGGGCGRDRDDRGGGELRGASPKRPHDDLEGSPGLPGDSRGETEGGLASSKRARGARPLAQPQQAGGEAVPCQQGGPGEAEGPGVEGMSPTASLAHRMRQQVLWEPAQAAQAVQQPEEREAAACPAGQGAHQQQGQQQQVGQRQQLERRQEQQQGQQAMDVALAGCLEAALQRCIAEGRLPNAAGSSEDALAAYPRARVLQPTAKQKKVLPAGLAYTSPFALAVAAAARRVAGSSGGAQAAEQASAEAVAALLVGRAELPACVEARRTGGHLNFYLAAEGAGASASSQGASSKPASGSASGAPAALAPAQGEQHAAGGGGLLQRGVGAAEAPSAGAGTGAGPVPRGVQRHFEFTMVRSNDSSVIPGEYELYKKYQVVHHGDAPGEVTVTSFKRFLCDSPLRHSPPGEHPPGACPPCGYGSFHQQYWIDGRLVAVGVVDVLPSCLSSVYLFWDPDLGPLSLGKVSALQEIEWVRQASATCPRLHYYYLGFYLHDCHRMRYKGDYAPSDLLCPKNKCWVPLGRCQRALEAAPDEMVAISELPGALEGLGEEHLVAHGRPMAPPVEPAPEEVDEVKLFLQPNPMARGQMLTLRSLLGTGALSPGVQHTLRQRIAEWVRAVGPCWHKLLYHVM